MSFPYRIFNDLSSKLKAAESNVEKVREQYEAKITAIVEEYEDKLRNKSSRVHTVSDQTQQTDHVDEELKIENCKEAVAVDDVISHLKNKVSQLTFENNRYHLMLSNCTMCSDDHSFENSSTFLHSSTQSLPTPIPLLSSTPAAMSMSSPTPTVKSCTAVPREFSSTFGNLAPPEPSSTPEIAPSPDPSPMPTVKSCTAEAGWSVVIKRDHAFITRLVKCSTKLEKKYMTPTHKRKERLFSRKKRTNDIVPKEFTSIFDNLAQPEPDVAKQVPGTIYPEVKWNLVKFKPVLPHPESCPLYSCSQDPSFYEDHIIGCINPYFKDSGIQTKFLQRNPFGSLPGFVTNLGVVAVPEAPVGGYVYCPDAKRWMIHAAIPSTEGGGRSSRGSLPSRARRRG